MSRVGDSVTVQTEAKVLALNFVNTHNDTVFPEGTLLHEPF